MDSGAHGIIVPMVNSVDDAKRAVAAVYYPPRGTRGVGLARAQGYGSSFEKYQAWLKQETIIIIQVEHVNSVKNLEKILSVEGVDGFIVGPYDLSASIGFPGAFGHPKVEAAMNEILRVKRKLQKSGGFHIVEPDPKRLQQVIKQGYNFNAYSVDFRMIDCACRDGLRIGRKKWKL